MTDPGISGATPSLPSLSGRVLDGRYRMDALVGAGGMGVVYAGWHIKLEKRVAIKLLDPRFADQPDAVKRFLREARSASKISHRNVVEVMDFGQDEDLVYFVMEFLEGADLSAVIRRSAPLPWPRAKRILVQIVRALKAAHTQGIVHRDIKPANCFVVKTPDDEPDVVKVLDFGIAKVVDSGTHTDGLTSTSQVIGTALYMAPEQAMGKPIDARTDVYALGTMAFEMVSGRKPFVGATSFEVLMKRVNETPPSICDYVPALDAGIDAMIQCAMARDPDQRFQSMRAFEEALAELPGEADAAGDVHIPLLTEADLESGSNNAGGGDLRTADGVLRRADSGTSTLTTDRVANGTPENLSMPLSGPVGATEVGPPLPVATDDTIDPSQTPTASIGPVLSEVPVLDAAPPQEANPPEAAARSWWPWMAVGLLALLGGGLWMAQAGSGGEASASAKPIAPRSTAAPEPDSVASAASAGAVPVAEPARASSDDPPVKPGVDSAAGSADSAGEGDPADSVVTPDAGSVAGLDAAPGEPDPPEARTSTPAARKKKKKKKKKKSGSRKPKPSPTRGAALSALAKKAKKRCTAEPGTKVVLNVFVSAAGTFSTTRDGGSTAGADAVSCVIGVVKGSSLPSGPSELRHVNVSF